VWFVQGSAAPALGDAPRFDSSRAGPILGNAPLFESAKGGSSTAAAAAAVAVTGEEAAGGAPEEETLVRCRLSNLFVYVMSHKAVKGVMDHSASWMTKVVLSDQHHVAIFTKWSHITTGLGCNSTCCPVIMCSRLSQFAAQTLESYDFASSSIQHVVWTTVP
jgi:hypothetical protein